MKEKIIAFMTVGIMMLTRCGVSDVTSGQTDDSADKTTNPSEVETGTASTPAEEPTAPGESNTGNSDGSMEESEFKVLKEKQYTWLEYTITLPDDWIGRCVIEENEVGFSIYQKASYEKDDSTGYICGFFRTQEPVEYDHGKVIIAYTKAGTLYYMVQPTDVPCDTDDEKITGEYIRMCQQVPQLRTSLQIAASGLHDYAEEYMLSTSSILPLDPAILAGMSDNSLWIARNEIYARHGRQFTNEYLQQYFNQHTWYEGTIPPQEFQESLLNQTERDNLQLLMTAEKEYDILHPYPKMYQASKTVSEDLNGDGKMDKISYQVMEQEHGELLCTLTVNDNTYIVNELSDPMSDTGMTNPLADCFYITDILESDGILEIAVPDEGPSEDPITYFFQYDGTLSCIGQVPGFPFADLNGGLNGFDGYGGIAGCSRIDLIETAYLQDRRWYDGSRIIDLGLGWCDFLPSSSHTLYEDLPVYLELEETSPTIVIPAQEEVFFLGTDRERWIRIKGKNGSEGYILVENGNIVALNKPADQVFSGLQFSD